MWEYNYNYGEYLQHGLFSNIKSAAHKYIKKVKTKAGEWRYIYEEAVNKKRKDDTMNNALDYSKKMDEERRNKQTEIKKEVDAKNNLKNKKAGEQRAAIVKAQQEYKKNSLDYSKKMDAERRRKEEEILKENESLKEKNAIDAYNKIAEERGLKKIKSSKNIKIKLNPNNIGNKSYDQLAAIEAYNARANQITNRIQEVRDNNNKNSYRAEEYLKKKKKG